jgi:hypothetical protein
MVMAILQSKVGDQEDREPKNKKNKVRLLDFLRRKEVDGQ